MIACQLENKVTPIKEPMEPQWIFRIYAAIATMRATPTKKNHHSSQERQRRKSPNVEAIPLPPLNFKVTGKMCPMMTNKPQKYRVKSDTRIFVPANT